MVSGQYIGTGLLIAISALGSLIALVVPTYIIGLMRIIPIAIGIKNLVETRKKDTSPSRQVIQDKKNKSSLSFLSYHESNLTAFTVQLSKTKKKPALLDLDYIYNNSENNLSWSMCKELKSETILRASYFIDNLQFK